MLKEETFLMEVLMLLFAMDLPVMLYLKLGESIYDIVESRNLHNDEFMHRFAYENYGGTPVLGVAKPVIIGHGISNDVAFCNMLSLAEKMIETDVCGIIRNAFQNAANPA